MHLSEEASKTKMAPNLSYYTQKRKRTVCAISLDIVIMLIVYL